MVAGQPLPLVSLEGEVGDFSKEVTSGEVADEEGVLNHVQHCRIAQKSIEFL